MVTKDLAQAHAMGDVERVFDEIFEVLQDWSPRLAAKIAAAQSGRDLTDSVLSRIVEADALEILRRHNGRFYGAGFCADSDLLASGNPLAWWQGPDHSPLGSIVFDGEQVAIDMRRLEWFRVPQRTAHSHVAGPYVDYLCSNEITITSANPVVVDGRFAGVICIDVLVTDLEDLLAEPMAELGREVSLINSASRVVVTNDSRYVTGDVIAEVGNSAGERGGGRRLAERVESSKYPFSLVRFGD